MAGMSTPDRRNPVGMARSSEPVMHRGPNLSSLDPRLAGTMVASDEEDDPRSAGDRIFQALVDGVPGPVEIHAVKVERTVWLNRTAAKALVPGTVERFADPWARWNGPRLAGRKIGFQHPWCRIT